MPDSDSDCETPIIRPTNWSHRMVSGSAAPEKGKLKIPLISAFKRAQSSNLQLTMINLMKSVRSKVMITVKAPPKC